MRIPASLLALLLASLAAHPAAAQSAADYPGRPVTLVVPFAPGGPTDVIGGDGGEEGREFYLRRASTLAAARCPVAPPYRAGSNAG